MFCPCCGAENEKGSRYCASCGNELSRTSGSGSEERPRSGSVGTTLKRLVGTTRRARLITAGTVTALLVAIVAFIALAPADDEAAVPQDGLTRALDARCVQHKVAIAAAQRRALASGTLAAVSRYGESMVPIAGQWRTELGRAEVPRDRTELVDALSAALLEVEIEAGTLGRAARESKRRELATAAARVDVATSHVEDAIQALELRRCGQLEISQGKLIRQ